MSLCRAYSAPAIRSNLPNCMKELHERIRRPNFVAKAPGPADLLYALRTCIARLRYETRSVTARAGTTIQAFAELGQWSAAACADCWNSDGLLVERSIGDDHAVGND